MKLNLINGNNNPYTTKTDLLLCFYKLNNYTKERINKEIGMKVHQTRYDLTYFKPRNAMQVLKLLTWASTYSYRISYSDNLMEKSTLFFHHTERPKPYFFKD